MSGRLFEVNNIYNFNTFARGVLHNTYTHAMVVCEMNYQKALADASVNITQEQILPQLPPGTPTAIEKYTFFQFQLPDGSMPVLALEWIDINTINKVVSQTLTVTVPDIATSDIPVIRDAIYSLGFQNVVITVT